jgi:hypothetical protein
LLGIVGHVLSRLELGLVQLLRILLDIGAAVRSRGWVLHLGFIPLSIAGLRHLIIGLPVVLLCVGHGWLLAAVAVRWLLVLGHVWVALVRGAGVGLLLGVEDVLRLLRDDCVGADVIFLFPLLRLLRVSVSFSVVGGGRVGGLDLGLRGQALADGNFSSRCNLVGQSFIGNMDGLTLQEGLKL